jgi:uncharacterized protein
MTSGGPPGRFAEQVAELRRKIARMEGRTAAAVPAPAGATRAAAPLDGGAECANGAGVHWRMCRDWPAHFRHGNADVGALSELPASLLEVLSEESGWAVPPERWAFVDTETSGLAGGSGTFAFLVGGGAITASGFEVHQFFMREPGEEASLLDGFTEWLSAFDVLVTYNGRAFDIPLLETRYRLARRKPPFARLRHIDLLYSARRLWRLALERCRLQDLEVRILGFERVGDTPGSLIPQLYFDFLRTGNAGPLNGVFEHNALDILSLACLAAIVPAAFREPARLRSAAEMLGIARWLRNEQRFEEALALMREAVKRPLAEPLLYDTLWHTADIERRLGHAAAAVALWSELSTVANPWRAQALERLAIHYEHRERNPAMALELTRAAMALGVTEALEKRLHRLERAVRRPRSARLL